MPAQVDSRQLEAVHGDRIPVPKPPVHPDRQRIGVVRPRSGGRVRRLHQRGQRADVVPVLVRGGNQLQLGRCGRIRGGIRQQLLDGGQVVGCVYQQLGS